MKAIPQISKVMTPMPHTVGIDIPLKKAFEMMKEYKIRHLPVQDAGKLVGILTERDVHLAMSFSGSGTMTVDDVMMPDPYTVAPEIPLDEVVSTMAEHKYGSVIIEQANGKVVGIFTAVDALRVLADVLHQRFKAR